MASGELPLRAALAIGRRVRRVRMPKMGLLLKKGAELALGSAPRLTDTVSGFRFRLDATNHNNCMMLFGRFSPELVAVVEAFVARGESVLDLGAQLGYITAHLARAVGPAGSVASFEPDPNALASLHVTVRENRLDWVRVFPCAAGARQARLRFEVAKTLGWSRIVDAAFEGPNVVEVEVVSVSDLALRGDIRRPVRFAKIDVEGHELDALRGLALVLREDRPTLMIEVNPKLLAAAGTSAGETLAFIRAGNYRTFLISERRSLLGGGRVFLRAFDGDLATFGDVLCIPRECPLPSHPNLTFQV